ncbi:MAG: hypothetical protein J0H88_12920 [Sphingomonadales bacterium]|nr:hypothetical protein [Sphingomonadales bacterium]
MAAFAGSLFDCARVVARVLAGALALVGLTAPANAQMHSEKPAPAVAKAMATGFADIAPKQNISKGEEEHDT